MLKKSHIFFYSIVTVLLLSCGGKDTSTSTEATTDSTEQVAESDTTADTEAPEAKENEAPEEESAPTAESVSERLQGKWVSLDDAKSVIEFRVDLRVDIYEEKMVDKAQFSIASACPDNPDQKSDKPAYIVAEDMCWFIETLNDKELVLTYTARGNTLKYKKIE